MPCALGCRNLDTDTHPAHVSLASLFLVGLSGDVSKQGSLPKATGITQKCLTGTPTVIQEMSGCQNSGLFGVPYILGQYSHGKPKTDHDCDNPPHNEMPPSICEDGSQRLQ